MKVAEFRVSLDVGPRLSTESHGGHLRFRRRRIVMLFPFDLYDFILLSAPVLRQSWLPELKCHTLKRWHCDHKMIHLSGVQIWPYC